MPAQHGHDLVIRFAAINGADAAYHAGRKQDLGPLDGSFADDADVQGIAIPLVGIVTQGGDPSAAIGAGDEPIQCGWLRRGPLRL